MTVINTNTISLNAQRNLQTNSASLTTTIQRLSSGLRINSARDDAAGLAISERFSTQIRGLNVAVRNANDGISLAQTAEGALGEVSSNLQRIRELSVQSANATNSASDRAALNAEVTQLVDEIDRVAKQAEFNGTRLLDGSFLSQLFQVGANAGQAIAIEKTTDARAAELGNAVFDSVSYEFNVLGPTAVVGTAGSITGLSITDSKGVVTNFNDVTFEVGETGVQASQKFAAAINAKFGETGILASVGPPGNQISLESVKESTNSAGAFTGFIVNFVPPGTGLGINIPPSQNTVAPASQKLSDLDISSVAGAGRAMTIIDKALTTVNSARADLGAVQNRFSSVVANLTTSSENLTASRSRIRDTDYAKETAELTRTQILQQAGTALLAQANQIPQNVLSLLR